MKILICNVGSTSLKYKLFDMDAGECVLASGGAERVGAPGGSFYWAENGEKRREDGVFLDHGAAIRRMLRALDAAGVTLEDISCVGFKVVHAKGVTGVQHLTERVLQAMADFNSVAPAHNPPYIAAIRQFREIMPDTPLIGAFETAFHATLPRRISRICVPLCGRPDGPDGSEAGFLPSGRERVPVCGAGWAQRGYQHGPFAPVRHSQQ